MKILISDPISQDGLDYLEKQDGIEGVYQPDLSPDELVSAIGDAAGLIVRSKTQVGGGKLTVRRFYINDRHLRLRRQVSAYLVDLGTDFGQRLGRIVVQLEACRDSGYTQGALGFEIFDPVSRGDGPLQRRGDETAYQV